MNKLFGRPLSLAVIGCLETTLFESDTVDQLFPMCSPSSRSRRTSRTWTLLPCLTCSVTPIEEYIERNRTNRTIGIYGDDNPRKISHQPSHSYSGLSRINQLCAVALRHCWCVNTSEKARTHQCFMTRSDLRGQRNLIQLT
jgi:hypothetical protein